MDNTDPLAPLYYAGDVREHADKASKAIAAVHRRPVNLRRADVTSAEAVLRGARVSAMLDGHSGLLSAKPDGALAAAIDVASLLAPAQVEDSCRIFLRAPLQMLAKMDVLAGGDGMPADARAAVRLTKLAGLITVKNVSPSMLTCVTHAEIACQHLFGDRSGIVARAASRLAAVATGFDPRGLIIPETLLNRHRKQYLSLLAGTDTTKVESLVPLTVFLLDAWTAGAAQAEVIARDVREAQGH